IITASSKSHALLKNVFFIAARNTPVGTKNAKARDFISCAVLIVIPLVSDICSNSFSLISVQFGDF
ncbi:MAG: hypothetical protein QXI58_08260, partial [Candidatus Micrarchaeia archaeon]